jgi:hypothetical protein
MGVATLFTLVALLPDLLMLLRGYHPWDALLGARSPAPSDFGLQDLLRLTTGSVRGGVVLAAASFAGLLVLVVGRSWRLRWGAVAWAISLVTWLVIVLLGRSDTEALMPSMAVLLVPAAVGVAFAVGLGAQSIEIDVLGGQFGWRQLVSVVASVALAAGVIPLLVLMTDGAWDMPDNDHPSVVGALDGRGASQERSLWLGDPDDLPMRSRELVAGVGYALTDDADPTLLTATEVGDGPVDREVEDVLRAALERGPGRLGVELAPLGVRYLIVTDGTNPGSGIRATPAVAQVAAQLGEQMDLDLVDLAPGLQVYTNEAAWPVRSTRPSPATDAAAADRRAVLGRGEAPVTYTGPLPDASSLDVSFNPDGGWHLDVDERAIPQERSPEGVQSYEVERGGTATLDYRPAWSHRLLLVLQLIVLCALVATARRGRWRRPEEPDVTSARRRGKVAS